MPTASKYHAARAKVQSNPFERGITLLPRLIKLSLASPARYGKKFLRTDEQIYNYTTFITDTPSQTPYPMYRPACMHMDTCPLVVASYLGTGLIKRTIILCCDKVI